MQDTPALHNPGDVEFSGTAEGIVPLVCNKSECHCQGSLLVLERQQTSAECTDWVFGVRWSPEKFLDKAIQVGHPFGEFSGLLPEVKHACEKLARSRYEDIVNLRCKRLGEWLKLTRSLQGDESEIKVLTWLVTAQLHQWHYPSDRGRLSMRSLDVPGFYNGLRLEFLFR